MATFVDQPGQLRDAAETLRGAAHFYIDTEFESTRNGTTLALVQISRGDEIFLVDALRRLDVEILRDVIGQAEAEWVLHAGLQDLALLVEWLRLPAPPKVFDTQIAWGLVGPEHSVSLAYLEFRILGLRKMKTHQADDWIRRPLPRAQLEYAAADIETLPAIRDDLGKRCRELGREDLVHEVSRELLGVEPETPPTLSLASFRNAWQLDVHNQAALRFLVEWYQDLSPMERRDAPGNKVLLSIASRLPANGRELARIKGVPRRWAEREGDRFAAELNRAVHRADAADFVPIDPPPYATFEDVLLDGWLAMTRAELCARLSMAPEIALPARTMRAIGEAIRTAGYDRAAGAEALAGWRARLLREPFLEAVARAAADPAAPGATSADPRP